MSIEFQIFRADILCEVGRFGFDFYFIFLLIFFN